MPRELLGDSEATLRLIDDFLDNVRHPDGEVAAHGPRLEQLLDAVDAGATRLDELRPVVHRVHAELAQALGQLRRSRGVLESSTPDRALTTQQLSDAAALVVDAERRLESIASLFTLGAGPA